MKEMTTPGRLSNPPIQEALVDLRIASATSINAPVLEPLKMQFASRFPKSRPLHRLEARIEARAAGQPPNVQARDVGFHGLFLKDEAESRMVQFRIDGFTLNHLTGYTSADDLFAEALNLWQAYVNVVRPTAVIRVALRYINRLLLPFRDGDPFDRFLAAPANMPPNAPQQVADFLIRTVASVPEIDGTAIVTQRLEHATQPTTPFLLDIDVFKEHAFGTASEELEPFLQRLRVVKNTLFFSFLTDEALEPYR
jgi:uncharacterized protein (TIGR04255 family)